MTQKWLYGPEKFTGLSRNGPLGAVSRKPRKLFGPVKPLQNLEPCDYRAFYSQILKMKGGSLHKTSFRRIHFPVFRYRWSKSGFTGPKTFRGFRETGPWPEKKVIFLLKNPFNATSPLIRPIIYFPWPKGGRINGAPLTGTGVGP